MSDSVPDLDSLRPSDVWRWFFEICAIPHGSGDTARLRAHLRDRLAALGIDVQEDAAGNLIARRPASAGMEAAPIVCLQAHLDMVCAARAGSTHDFTRDGIKAKLVRKDDQKLWVTADGTSLGADDGIGVAIGLAVLADPGPRSGGLELLLTADEETTMSGAQGLRDGALRARYLINLDSEEHGVITVGSAGGFNGVVTKDIKEDSFEVVDKNQVINDLLLLRVSGCAGGHSGADIHRGGASAVALILQLIDEALQNGARLVRARGGSAMNAIPMDAEALLHFGSGNGADFARKVNEFGK